MKFPHLKKLNVLTFLLAGLVLPAHAALYSYSGGSYAIPDGSLAGVSSQITVSGTGISLSDVTVTLNVSSGYNGDLYAYLSYNGALVTLLNRVGVGTAGGNGGSVFGNSGAGLNSLVLNSSGTDVHLQTGGSVLTGTYAADGRNINPLSPAVNFDASGTQTLDGTFGGMNPNGTWTLFFADVSGGGGTSVLTGWSLDITAVPEPANMALGLLGGFFIIASVVSRLKLRLK